MAKKSKMPKSYRPRAGWAVVALLAVIVLGSAVAAHAADVSVLSPKRLSISAQAGVEWEHRTDVSQASYRVPSVKLVPVWKLWGPVKDGVEHEGGSFAVVAPLQIGLDADHKFRGGVYVSMCLWSGADQP